ncbi:nuclear localization sequence-binding protein-like [Pyrus ussuriensis x Pyrus communis]|uniref:Nuclear localization sequence-binding protein-like n=1 Tax=Pyrus ussuriensis x Pyrus communis TaxID=2448454 RepID=A0A5N5H6N9_9ROSA|nr:nuclear localization sequence-binding protein-like [Pyrus ussuriensis x Pyrus communis]
MPERDIMPWNSMIAGYSQAGYYEECKELNREMLSLGKFRPVGLTVVSVLQACLQSNDLMLGMEVHQFVNENQIEMDVLLCNALIGLYARCGSLDYAQELFDEMSERDEVTYGLVQNNRHEDALDLICEMRACGCKPNTTMTLSSILPTIFYFSNLKVRKEVHAYAAGREVAASPAVVVSLPSVVVSGGGSECVICKEEMREDRDVCELPCRHLFHWMCILRWLRKRNTCPCCRFTLPTEDVFGEIQRLWEILHIVGNEKTKKIIFICVLAQVCILQLKITMTATTGMEDGTWSDRKMEGDGGLRTLKCLRGRLLAERQASRVAKEDAELIGKKLVELQKQLQEEIKLKEKAEKKLKYLKKKLESLNISSKNSEKSCTQSTTTSSGSNHPETHKAKSKVAESEIPEESRQNAADSTTSEQSCESTFTEENTSSQSTSGSSSSSSLECSSPKGFCHNPTHKSEDPEIEDSNRYNKICKIFSVVHNTFALVPVNMPATCDTSTELKPVGENFRQVLDALRASPPHAQKPGKWAIVAQKMSKTSPIHVQKSGNWVDPCVPD